MRVTRGISEAARSSCSSALSPRLAIMATSLVALTGNVHHNTYVDRHGGQGRRRHRGGARRRDGGSQRYVAGRQRDGPTLDATAFRSMFTAGQFPGPQGGGSFAPVHVLRQPVARWHLPCPVSAANPPAYDRTRTPRCTWWRRRGLARAGAHPVPGPRDLLPGGLPARGRRVHRRRPAQQRRRQQPQDPRRGGSADGHRQLPGPRATSRKTARATRRPSSTKRP